MVLKFYNTFTNKKEVFKPLKKGLVTIYNCGPTVYFYAHIGNYRAFVFADILRRYLEYKGLRVKQIMNITDVGHMVADADTGKDKMEESAKKEKKTPLEIAEFYTKAFLEDWNSLNMKEPFKRPKATEHVKEMIAIIEKLIKKGFAYEKNGNVFFRVGGGKFSKYGMLSGNTLDKLKVGARLEAHPEKEDPRDFALWLRDPNHIMQWTSPWGKGYPGWHIECSAMSMKYLGETIDIHTGGEDNIFPHHEAEIAQSECANGKKFVRYWMHARHLMVNGEKMSKSKGNFFTLKDLLEKGYDPLSIRYLLLSAQYRTKLNFTEQGIKDSDEVLKKFNDFLGRAKKGKDDKSIEKLISKVEKEFEKSMDDDLNISGALAAIFEFLKEANKIGAGPKAAKTLLKFDSVLGLNLGETESWRSLKEASSDIKKLLLEREEFRKERNFKEADKIRDILKKKGIEIEDGPEGPKWKV
ncbi:MAG: cysteine--tRNA ligase [Candidatus Aenigmarchaeota archaeon]|nr:cysteine--tRNA ligase [Candidatus Aenigmarchaeota archaeon]